MSEDSVGGFQNFMGVFGEGEENSMAGPDIGGTFVESDLSSLSLFSTSRKEKSEVIILFEVEKLSYC